MAGIRGAKNPFPSTPKQGPSGVFNQQGSAGPFKHADVKAHAHSSDRKGPPSSRNSGTKAGKSHYQNGGLKDGTAA